MKSPYKIDIFLENLQGLTTLKVFGADQRQHDRMNQAAEEFRVITMKVLIMQLNSISIMDAVAYGGTALGIYFAVTGYLYQGADLYQSLLIILLSAEFFLPMRLLGSYFHIAMNGMAASDRMFTLLDQQPEKTGPITGLPEALDIKGHHISFSYDADKTTLKNLSFDFPAGSFIGIAGPSGSGKSTLAKLLCGDLKTQSGSLTLGECSFNDFSFETQKQLMTKIGFQPNLFKGTLRENLLMGKPDATDEEIKAAVKEAALDDFIETLPNGLDTKVGESGIKLSGGQKQRVAIARAMLRKSSIIIFDESTSSLDNIAQAQIKKSIDNIKGKSTIVIVAHRLSTIKNVDKIFFLEDGEIVDSGTFKELYKRNKSFKQIFLAENI